MSLTKIITTTPPRESAGSETAKRYDYQKDLCLFMLIESYDSNNDFVMLLDYFDDIVLLDNAINPQKIKFFQVKTKGAGHWLLKDLIRAEEGKLSIIGKLFSNKLLFGEYTESLNFVTNASIKIDLPEENKDTATLQDFCAAQLKHAVVAKVKDHLQKELTLPEKPNFEQLTFFKVHGLSLTDSATHCVGALSNLLEKLNPNFNGNASLAYKKLFNEIKIKTSKTLKESAFLDDLSFIIREKGITKKEFTELLQAAGLYKNPDHTWNAIHTDLAAAGAGVSLINHFKTAWREASVKALSQPNNIPLIKTTEHIKTIVKASLNDSGNLNLNIIDLVNSIMAACHPLPHDVFDGKFIKGAILMELYND